MRINKLELYGFKSFPDRTTFEFGEGISCVVGPNGSGKSNVVDALRWVIGEQSARSLRGKEMSDVIFAGSAVRSPVGFAEVTLTLGVGNGEPFPGDYARFEELEIGRRLYRDGTSEYLINRVKARRRDIVDLFLDTGVGANLYSFIAQGQVDRIVNQSPKERRALIDEAAGISRYKVRREEALARLRATGAQLDRAADVADEMRRRLDVLARQVLKAGRFRRVRAKIRQLELALGVVKYHALSEDRRALRRRLRELVGEVGAAGRSVERLEGELRTREAELELSRAELTRIRERAAELEADRREKEGAASLHRSRHEAFLEEAERAAKRRRGAEQEICAAERRREQLEEEQQQVEAALRAVDVDGATTRLHRAREEVERRRRDLAALERRAAEVEARRAALEEALAQVEQPAELPPLETIPLDGVDDEVEEARRALEREEAREREARERLEQVRRQARERELRAQQALAHYERALAAYEEEIRRREEERAEQVRALERAIAAAEREAVEAHRRARNEARARLQRWVRAWRERHEQHRRRLVERRAQRQRAARQRLSDASRALEQQESSAIDAARAEVDRTPWRRAQERVRAAEEAVERAREARDRAREELAVLRSRRKALEAEWRALEERREACIPSAWRDLPVLDAVADEDDPRRVARPELLELPVVEMDVGLPPEGRGVLRGVRPAWRVVDTAEEALAVLRREGPPVASRDGAIRVDADGLVELGWDAGSRWVELTGELREVGTVLERAETALRRAEERLVEAEEERRLARAASADAERALREAEREAVDRVRAWLRERAAELRRRTEAEERAVIQEAERRMATLEEERRRWEEQVRAVEEAIERRDVAPSAEVGRLRERLAALPPVVRGDRPVRPVLPSDDGRGVEEAEKAWDEARARVRAARMVLAERIERRAELQIRARAVEAELARRAEAERRREREVERLRRSLDELEAVEGLDDARRASERAQHDVERVTREWEAIRQRAAELREEQIRLRTRLEALVEAAERARSTVMEAEAEQRRAQVRAEEALRASEEARARAEELARERSELQGKIADLGRRVKERDAAVKRVQQALEGAREALRRSETERAEVEAEVKRLQAELESLRQRLGERYQVSLAGMLDRLSMRGALVLDAGAGAAEPLVVGTTTLDAVEPLVVQPSMLDDEKAVVDAVRAVTRLREELEQLGEVNLAAEEEYRELLERWEELDRQRDDLERSVKSIRAAIASMNRTCRERFRDAYDRINEAFQDAYPRLVGGGDARLALTDEEDLLETGVDIFVRPPGKRLQNLTLLSGGEKAMTAIALLLAIFKVRPSPFCVLDEVDAPLDEANGHRFNAMIREMSTRSQFIVITHNRTTMECADVLYGVTMADPGVSKLVSVALDRV